MQGLHATEDIQDTIVARLERLMNGATVAQATADIADQSARTVVSEVLLSLYVDALLTGLETLTILSHDQVEEVKHSLSLPQFDLLAT